MKTINELMLMICNVLLKLKILKVDDVYSDSLGVVEWNTKKSYPIIYGWTYGQYYYRIKKINKKRNNNMKNIIHNLLANDKVFGSFMIIGTIVALARMIF